MDTISLILGLGLLALFAIPIIYLILKSNAQTSKVKQRAYDFATQNKLKIDEFEQVGNTIIALDVSNKRIIFSKAGSENQFEIIDLTQYATIQLQQDLQTKNSEKIQFLALNFAAKQKHIPKSICFYDEAGNDIIAPEIRLQQARKWETKITPLIAA
ncbi:hypothetical protein JM79_0317 [Gramella sp. Hel_I_59]|uniref:hypothetical protein n=1 Tax=Gramella sp. Hel_I_59 TaxID=1249978 RepID=UPI00115160FC|nr:hypothetical protein [Gramella sp. Hel_I_59]TQI69439.1 hypothetical protein JM79_0317 [Gramella sp. Hel_I_59]